MIITVVDDPFDADAWDSAMELMCCGPVPPEAYKEPEQWAVEELEASIEEGSNDAPETAWANVPDAVLGLE